MQGLTRHKSVSFKELFIFLVVHLHIGFKTPKFDRYNVHGDLVAHLKRFCNKFKLIQKLLSTATAPKIDTLKLTSQIKSKVVVSSK